MARRTGNLVAGVAGLNPSGHRWLIAMTVKAGSIGLCRWEFRRIANVCRRKRLDMVTAGAVASLARLALEAMRIAGLYFFVRALRQGLPDIFMAGAAGFRTDECRFGRWFRGGRGRLSLLCGTQQRGRQYC
jgi:hypothetical protein